MPNPAEEQEKPKGLTGKQKLINRLCVRYGLDPNNESDRSTVKNALLYNLTVMRTLRVADIRAIMVEAGGEFKDGTASTAIGVGGKILGMIPGIGGMISAGADAAKFAAKEMEMRSVEKEAEGIKKLGGLDFDTRKDIAAVFTLLSFDKLKGLNPEQVVKLGQEHCGRALKAIADKKIPGNVIKAETVLNIAQVGTGVERKPGEEKSEAAQLREDKEHMKALKQLADVEAIDLGEKPASAVAGASVAKLSQRKSEIQK
jgi:hypothetical protein